MITEEQEKQPANKDDAKEAPSSTPPPKIEDKGKSKETKTPKKPPKKKKKDGFISWFKRISPFIQFVMMILGICTLIAYILVNNDQGERIKKSIELSTTSSEIDLRAYCILKPTVAFYNVGNGKRPYVKFAIKNVGKTPAYKVSIKTALMISDKIPNHDVIDGEKITAMIIGAGDSTATQKTMASFVIDDLTAYNIIKDKWDLIFIGRVTYEDVFKKERYLYFGAYFDWKNTIANIIPGYMDAN